MPLVRLARELGADIIKADPTERVADFHRVVEAARCPTLVRGGGKELGPVLEKSAALMAQAPPAWFTAATSINTAIRRRWCVR